MGKGAGFNSGLQDKRGLVVIGGYGAGFRVCLGFHFDSPLSSFIRAQYTPSYEYARSAGHCDHGN
jgi:hypothetical protein